MRIVQCIDRLRIDGGAERLQRTFAEAVADLPVELTIMTLRENDPAAERELEELGARVVRFVSNRFLDGRRARELLSFVRKERFDLIHTHLVRSTVLGAIAGRVAGIPSVATLHNTMDNGRTPRPLALLEGWVLRHHVDRVVAVGWETAAAHARRVGGRWTEVIPNAVPEGEALSEGERAAVRAELEVPDGAVLALAAGRLQPQKCFSDLLRAFARLQGRAPATHLRIAGRGPLELELRAEIARLGLESRVRLLGMRADLPRLLAASDLYVSSSGWEGLPVAMLEAMAAGLPLVATAVGDVPRVVDADSGILVPAHRSEALAGAVLKLLQQPGRMRALGAAGRRRVQRDFGAKAWARRILALYAGILDRPGHTAMAPAEETRCASQW